MAANDILETENSNSNDASQCKETSVLQTEVQKVEGKRLVHGYLVALFGFLFSGCAQNDIALIHTEY